MVKENDCFIQCFAESYNLYKVRHYGDKYCTIEKIFVTHNMSSYDVFTTKSDYCEDFDAFKRFPVEDFDKMRNKIQDKEKRFERDKLELINSLLNDIVMEK